MLFCNQVANEWVIPSALCMAFKAVYDDDKV